MKRDWRVHLLNPILRREFLTAKAAIRAGKLQFRESNMHGNTWYRLLWFR